MKSLVWWVPEKKGGIYSYSMSLWPAIREEARTRGWVVHEPLVLTMDRREELANQLLRIRPGIIHVQHEFGLFGGKLPPRYGFPRWVAGVRSELPETKICVTAHTILDRHFRYPWQGLNPHSLIRLASNWTWVPWVRPLWSDRSWGGLDGAIVHSERQAPTVRDSGCPEVKVIPHFVARTTRGGGRPIGRETHPVLAKIDLKTPLVLVFGYFTLEKGQDVAIEALALSKSNAVLLLAGDVRRPEDRIYFERCQAAIVRLGLQKRVFITGYIPDDFLDNFYSRATVVLAPFRATSGSGSLAQALARGSAILASNLDLNREIAERVPGCLEYFASEDPTSCAQALDRMLLDEEGRQKLGVAARQYATQYDPARIAAQHVDFYERLQS